MVNECYICFPLRRHLIFQWLVMRQTYSETSCMFLKLNLFSQRGYTEGVTSMLLVSRENVNMVYLRIWLNLDHQYQYKDFILASVLVLQLVKLVQE